MWRHVMRWLRLTPARPVVVWRVGARRRTGQDARPVERSSVVLSYDDFR